MKTVLSIVAACALAAASSAAQAAAPFADSAAPLSLAGIATAAQDDAAGDAGVGGGGTAIAIGFILLVLLGVAAVSGNNSNPDNRPASP